MLRSREVASLSVFTCLVLPWLEATETLFAPDLGSPEAIEASGGFLSGKHDQDREALRPMFAFRDSPAGPAVRVVGAGRKHQWVWFPLDGLIPAERFDLSFSAMSDEAWSAHSGASFFRVASGENEIDLRIHDGRLVVDARWPGGQDAWTAALDASGLEPDRWYRFRLALRGRSLEIHLDGDLRATLDGVAFDPLWSHGANGAQGIQLGGSPWKSSGVWIAGVSIDDRHPTDDDSPRFSRLVIEAGRELDPDVSLTVGSLHPGQKEWPPAENPSATPEQISSALEVVRTDKFLQATPIKHGKPDAAHPSMGRSGRFSYDWQVVDRTLDWFAEHRVEPFLSIDATPSILGGSVPPFSGEKLRTALSRSAAFRPEPPNDLVAWSAIVEDFVHHVVHEHGTEVPWWGVWNEPDQPGFWKGDLEDYLKLYSATVRAVRRADPDAVVGGPESGLDGPWIEGLINHCAEHELPLDFVSYHDYSGDLNSFAQARSRIDRFTRAAGLTTPVPIVVGEFNWSAGALHKPGWPRFHRDFWHLRAFGAAYTTAALTRMARLPAFDLVIWSHTQYGDPRRGGWAATQLIGPKGEQWAPYNALVGWRKVTGDRILATEEDFAPGVFALATRASDSGAVGIVLANYGFAQRQVRPLAVRVKGLREGDWKLACWAVDPHHGSRWDAAEDRPAGSAHQHLARLDAPDARRGDDGALEFELALPSWSSTFILISPPGADRHPEQP